MEEAAPGHPDQAEAQYLLAVAHRRTGKLGKVLEHLRKADELGWPEHDIRRQQYLMMVQAGDFEAAEPYLRKTLADGATDEVAVEVYEALAKGYLSTYRIPEAMECLQLWIQWQPEAVQPRMWRAEVHEHSEDWPAAVAEYRAILEIAPEDLKARLKLAEALITLKQTDEALEHYRRCVNQAPDNAEVLLGLAVASREVGARAEAKQSAEAALKLELDGEQQGQAWTVLGQIALEERRFEEAVDLLTKALERLPNQPHAHYALGMAYARTKEKEKAKYHTEVSAQILDDHERVSQIINRVKSQPNSADLRYEAATILLRLGLAEPAMFWFQSALRCDPDHQPTLAALSRIEGTDGQVNSGETGFGGLNTP